MIVTAAVKSPRSLGEVLGSAALPAEAELQLLAFIELLSKWNAVYNLTGIREPQQMLTRHIHDSIALTTFIGDSGDILDVGTGAGLPGIPIAIVRPGCNVTLLDANGKKTAFCEQARIELQLCNVRVLTCRMERLDPAQRFDYIVSRAFGPLAGLAALSAKHLRSGGSILAMKGPLAEEEVGSLPPLWDAQIHEIDVPGLEADRCIVALRPRISEQ